jgi:TetR/AcrR family transcriptional regulator, transcriptional repressor of aconitase
MPKVSQEHVDGRRAEILDGARRAFSTYGYEGATVARLEQEIGLSRGAIFHYFGSKRDLFVQLSLGENRRYIDLMIERGFDDAIRSMANENPEWLGMLIEIQVRLRHDPEFVRQLNEATEDRDRAANWLRGAQARGEFRGDVDFIDIGRFASMLLNGVALRVAGGDPIDVEPIIRLLRDAIAPR